MKFVKYITYEATRNAEWRDFYLNYSQFEIDLSILVRAPALNLRCLVEPEFDENGDRVLCMDEALDVYIRKLADEIRRVEDFVERERLIIKAQFTELNSRTENFDLFEGEILEERTRVEQKFTLLYRKIERLQNFLAVNKLAVIKITKKMRKRVAHRTAALLQSPSIADDLIEMAKKKRREEHPVHRSDESSGNRDDSSGTQGLFEEDEDTPLLRANESFDSQNIPLSPPLRFDALPYEGSPRRIRRGMSLGGVSELPSPISTNDQIHRSHDNLRKLSSNTASPEFDDHPVLVKDVENSINTRKSVTFEKNKQLVSSYQQETHETHVPGHVDTFRLAKDLVTRAQAAREKFIGMSFFEGPEINDIMNRIEKIHTSHFANGSRSMSVSRLQTPRLQYGHVDVFVLALFLGINITLFVLMLVIYFGTSVLDISAPHTNPMFRFTVNDSEAVMPIYRGLGLFILALWFWGGCLLVWQKNSINHVYLFDFDAQDHLSWLEACKAASVLSCLWLFSAVCYLGASHGVFNLLRVHNTSVYPLTLFVSIIVFLVVPLPFLPWTTRKSLLETLLHLLITPFGEVRFREFFVADQLTSMVVPLTDLQYILCYFTTSNWTIQENRYCANINTFAGPCLVALPYFWRLLQCIRKYFETHKKVHLINASKYLLSLFVILFSALHSNLANYKDDWDGFRIVWIVCVIISTIFSYCWDVRMDWGLWRSGSRRFLLRNNLLYRWRWGYYAVMIINFFFRFAWAVTITQSTLIPQSYFLATLAAVELYRRSQWSLFRLENEMINNEEEYRSTKLVPKVLVQ